MSDRTLVKIGVTESCVTFRTITHDRKSPQTFYVGREKFAELAHTGVALCQDIHSFASFFVNSKDGTLSICFTWLSLDGNCEMCGWEQSVSLPYDALMAFVKESAGENGPSEWAVLSIVPRERPQFVFHGKENLHAVLENKTVRRKLVRFLRDNFQWKGTDTICFYNDFLPYSFTFREFNSGCPGMCGGLILHGQEDMAKAYYSIHT